MRATLIHSLIGLTAVIVTAFWADRLLYVSKQGAETVLTVDELEQLVQEDEQQDKNQHQQEGQESAEQQRAAEKPADEPAGSTVEENEEEASTTRKADSPPSVASQPRPKINATGELVDALQATKTMPPEAAIPRAGSTDVEEPAAPPVEPVLLGSDATEGGLVSLQGEAGVGEPLAAPNAGAQVGLVCEIRFSSKPQWQVLCKIPGVMPAAIRSRPDFNEIAPLHDGRVSAPLPLVAFLESHPEYGGRWTLLLPNEWLLDVADQLLAHRGGWQPHLLVSDKTFRRWMDDAARFASGQEHQIQDVARLVATANVVYEQGRHNIVLRFHDLELKESSR